MATRTVPVTRVRRHPERARYDRDTLYSILDEGLICHLGFVAGGRPFVIPTIHARAGDVLYIHGSTASRMVRTLSEGVDCCVTVTILDGLVLARAAFKHSMNYRSAMVLGRAELVADPAEKEAGFAAVVEHVARGRWDGVRWPNRKEDKATAILRLPIDEFSAKLRTGPPLDDPGDLESDIWAGVLPLTIAAGPPLPSPDLKPGLRPPPYIKEYRR
jgi:nitroimidazol reductase NimA-like FMN-containing flavoprotein (pyridoxamine 5'-phosphate oxidase superfamily)